MAEAIGGVVSNLEHHLSQTHASEDSQNTQTHTISEVTERKWKESDAGGASYNAANSMILQREESLKSKKD